jgi:hypothetical protein
LVDKLKEWLDISPEGTKLIALTMYDRLVLGCMENLALAGMCEDIVFNERVTGFIVNYHVRDDLQV